MKPINIDQIPKSRSYDITLIGENIVFICVRRLLIFFFHWRVEKDNKYTLWIWVLFSLFTFITASLIDYDGLHIKILNEASTLIGRFSYAHNKFIE